jgi:polar amino acid transport system substrate-binding protein
MRKQIGMALMAVAAFTIMAAGAAFGDDIELAKKSTIEEILKNGELRVGFESGYMPFEMTEKTGAFIGFDIDMAKEMAKAMNVKFVPVNTAWDGIIPALLTKKFDIIMSGMTVTQERNMKINFADPYIVVGQTVIINKKHHGKIKSYKDLNDPKYIVTSKLGTTGEQSVKRLIPQGAIQVLRGRSNSRHGGRRRQSGCLCVRPALLRRLHGPAGRHRPTGVS